MKRGHPRFIGRKGVILAIAIIAGGLLAPAYCQPSGVTLLLQQTPTEGGMITPNTGIYHFEPNSEVTLTAFAKPGYRFIYWLGDVSDPTTNHTVVRLNEPKIIIAVFKSADNDAPAVGESLAPGGGGGYFGGGGLFASAADFSPPSGIVASGGAGPRSQGPIFLSLQANDGMQEAPEPATAVLLVLGGLFAFLRRGKKQAR